MTRRGWRGGMTNDRSTVERMLQTAIDDTSRYRVLKLLQENPAMSQRELARALGVSLGKANYCLRALVGRGLIKMRNFKNNENRRAYMYYLTQAGMEEKALMTIEFIRRKIDEFEALKLEIEQLRADEPAMTALVRADHPANELRGKA